MANESEKKGSKEFYSKIIEGTDGVTYLYATGILTCEVPGLVKAANGVLVTPTLRMDDDGNLQNFFFKDGNPQPLYDFCGHKEGVELVQPKMTSKDTKEKKILLMVPIDGEKRPEFYQLEAWGNIAKLMNIYYKKGQKISVLCKKNDTKGTSNGKVSDVWRVENISKVIENYKNAKGASSTNMNVSIGKEEKAQEEENDLPFND